MKNLNLVCRHTMYNSLRQLTYLAFPSHLLVRELLPSTCYVHSSVLYTGRQAGRQDLTVNVPGLLCRLMTDPFSAGQGTAQHLALLLWTKSRPWGHV